MKTLIAVVIAVAIAVHLACTMFDTAQAQVETQAKHRLVTIDNLTK